MTDSNANEKLSRALGEALEEEANDYAAKAAAAKHSFSDDFRSSFDMSIRGTSRGHRGLRIAFAAAAACALLGIGFISGTVISFTRGSAYRSSAVNLTADSIDTAADYAYADSEMEMGVADTAKAALDTSASTQSLTSSESERKLITTYDISAESTDFDNDTSALEQLTADLGGYIESSYLSTASGESSTRSISYTLRIPADKAETLVTQVGGTLNVTSMGTDTSDVTLDYYDSEARLESYRTELETLQKLMKEAEQVSDIIEIESRISEVSYTIDYYETTLRNYDDRIDNTTVNICIREVAHITETGSESVWTRIANGFEASLNGFCRTAVNIFVWVISNIIWIAAAAVIITVIAVVIRRRRRGR